MLALLPLRWFKVVATPAGTVFFHELGFFVLAAIAFATVRGRVFARAIDLTLGFTAAMAAGFAVWTAACLYGGVTLSSTVKEVAYLGCFVAVVGLVVLFAESADPAPLRILRWVGVATTIVLIAALGVSLRQNGVNPVTVLTSAVASGDPTQIESQLFRPAFAGFGFSTTDTVSQLRHEVFAGLLVALLVGSWALARCPFERVWQRSVYYVVTGVAALMIVLSLSRSIQLAAVAWPLFAGYRLVLRGRLSRRALMAIGVLVVGLIVLAVTGVLAVIGSRLSSSSSYNARGAKLGDALETIGQHPWAGGQYDDLISSHNFVLDAWLRGGVVMAALMAVALLIVVARLYGALRLLGGAPTELVAASAAFVLPLVRMFTIGAGLMTPPEWVALAFGFAATAVYARERARSRPRTGFADRQPVPRARVPVAP
jgi:O-antigen ligase